MVNAVFSIVAPYECQVDRANIWDTLKNGPELKLATRVNSITICPNVPFKYGIPNGHKVYLYKCNGDKMYRKMSGFGTRVTSCDFRRDGKLMAIGEENGILRICTTDKNTYHLRRISAHKSAINGTSFFVDGLNLASVGCDSLVNIWDVTLGTKKCQYNIKNSIEPIKGLVTGRSDCNIFFSGNLRGYVSMNDIRQSKPVKIFQTQNAISALALNASDNVLVLAHGAVVHLWDVRTQQFRIGSEYLQVDPTSSVAVSDVSRIHYKLVTGLCVVQHPDADQGEVVLTASMDKLMKLTSLSTWEELHQWRCALPLTAIASTPNCETIIVGGEKGLIKVHHLTQNKSSDDTAATKTEQEAAKPVEPESGEAMIDRMSKAFATGWKGGNQFMSMTTDEWLSQPFDGGPRRAPKEWLIGQREPVHGEPIKSVKNVPLIHECSEVSRAGYAFYQSAGNRQPFTRVDHLLTRFNHTRALSLVTRSRLLTRPKDNTRRTKKPEPMDSQRHLLFAIGVIRELLRRGTLATAIAGRNESQLFRLLRFIRRNVWRQTAVTACMELYNQILDLYDADELTRIEEFAKVNILLRRLHQNQNLLSTAAYLIRLTPNPTISMDTTNDLESSSPSRSNPHMSAKHLSVELETLKPTDSQLLKDAMATAVDANESVRVATPCRRSIDRSKVEEPSRLDCAEQMMEM